MTVQMQDIVDDNGTRYSVLVDGAEYWGLRVDIADDAAHVAGGSAFVAAAALQLATARTLQPAGTIEAIVMRPCDCGAVPAAPTTAECKMFNGIEIGTMLCRKGTVRP